ncbi:hypothetical protein, partial [Dyella sp.]|uniref:hypothetical protein n=1 Tax=Dyella sp. TaxID=1869338 RepID=UPI002B491BC8
LRHTFLHRHIREHTQLLHIQSAHHQTLAIDTGYDCAKADAFLNSLLEGFIYAARLALKAGSELPLSHVTVAGRHKNKIQGWDDNPSFPVALWMLGFHPSLLQVGAGV